MNETLDAIFEQVNIKVDEKSNIDSRQSHVCQDLCLVNVLQLFDTFEFHNELMIYQQIDSLPTIELCALIHHRQLDLKLKRDFRSRKFCGQALLVSRFEQSRPQLAMNFDCATNNLARQFIENHILDVFPS